MIIDIRKEITDAIIVPIIDSTLLGASNLMYYILSIYITT